MGWMRGTLAGGMLLGAIVLTYLGDRIHGELVNFIAMTGAGAALAAFAWAPGVAVGMPMAVIVGITGAMLLISVNTMLQRIVPNRWRGRVFGIADMATMSGLLTATGLLGLWPIPGLDACVPQVLTVLGVLMTATAMVMHGIQSRRAGMRGWQLLLWRLTQFYAKWRFGVQRVGPCTVPAQGPAILAANHTSFIDPLLMYATCPKRLIGFMVAKEYYDMPLIGWLLRGIGCIPATRTGQDLAATRDAIRRLEEGLLVGIFPQGRIERPDQDNRPRSGITLLAVHSRAPVIPVHISGTRHSESTAWSYLRRHKARVRYGRPVDLSEFYGRPIDRQTRERIAELIWSRIQELAPQREGGAA